MTNNIKGGFEMQTPGGKLNTNINAADVLTGDVSKKIMPTSPPVSSTKNSDIVVPIIAQNSAIQQARIAEATNFLDLLFGTVKGKHFGYLWTKQDESTYPFTVTEASERERMAHRAIELSDSGKDVYVGVNLTDTKPTKDKRVKAEDVTVQTATITDIDVEGGRHISTGDKIYLPTFSGAKALLPFTVSLLVDSGFGGLHGYCLYSEPITITDTNREEAKERNREFIKAIRKRAGIFSKAVDGVGDLPRILRMPGTYNYGIGREGAPLCRLVEINDVRFTPEELDSRLNSITPPKQETKSARATTQPLIQSDDPDYDLFRATRWLDALAPDILDDNEWLNVMSACKNIGIDYATVDCWNRRDPDSYNEEENLQRWNSITDPTYGIQHLCTIAKRYNACDPKADWREWLTLHPELKQGAGRHTRDFIKSCPINLHIPDNFQFNLRGITYVEQPRKEGGTPRFTTVTLTPLVPTKKFRNPVTGITELEFSIFVDDEWCKVEIDCDAVADTRELTKSLRKHGALIEKPDLLRSYCNAIIAANSDLPKIKAYNQTGWTDDDEFTDFAAPYLDNSVVRRAGFDYEKVFKPKGNPEAWKKKFCEVMKQGGAVAHVVMGTAAAALLARPLGLPNPQVHLHGKRSIGKTPMLRFAVSAFGDSRAGALSYTFAASPKARLEFATAYRDLPLIGEELESITKKEAEHLPQDIYNYSLGIGGQALQKNGTLRDQKIFSGARLTSGEHELGKGNSNGGELKRVLPLRCATLLDEDFAADLHGFCNKHHGLFLKQWIEYIKTHLDQISANYHFALRAAEGVLKHEGRKLDATQLKTLIVSLVTYEHFKCAIGLQEEINNAELCTDRNAITPDLPNECELSDTQRAEEFLASYVAGHEKFFTRDVTNGENGETEINPITAESYGKIFETGEVAIFPHKLREILENEGGFTSADKLISEWYDQGKLIHDKGEKTRTVKILKKAKRMYLFKANVIDKSESTTREEYYENIGAFD